MAHEIDWNIDWSQIWALIEELPPYSWRGLPLPKWEANRLMYRISDKFPTTGTAGIRKGLMVDRERLRDHDIIWLRKIGD